MKVHLIKKQTIHLASAKFICLSVGSAHMRNMMNSAIMAGKMLLMSNKTNEYEDLKIYGNKNRSTVQYLL